MIAQAADIRSDFLKLIDRPRVPLNVKIHQAFSDNLLLEFHFSFDSEASEIVPGILLKSPIATGRCPVVIALHGTGGAKADQVPFLSSLAHRGFIAVAIDGRYHGQRSSHGTGSAEYQDAIFRAWRDQKERPFFFDTVWDVMRLIDYLQTREDVDPSRIGLYGISKGGIETYLASAVDPRITVAIPCLGLESFKWAIDHDAWQSRIATIQCAFDAAAQESGVEHPDADFVHEFYSRVAPGLDDQFDGPAMAPLIAPRPFMPINGDSDDRTPLPGLQLCMEAARLAYHAAGADDRFVPLIQPNTGHHVTPESQTAAIDWFIQWLKP